MLSAEEIKNNFDTFLKLCGALGDRSESVISMVNHFNERLALAPASSRKEFHNAFPGGLIDHSLRVLANANALVKVWETTEDIPKDSLILSTLFHDFGKIGGVAAGQDLYLPQTSDWHRERGMMYTHNNNLEYMTTSDRALWLFQHFDIKLTEGEWLAIKLNDGHEADENRPYRMKESVLPLIVHAADRMACQQEKEISQNLIKRQEA
jgi:hypothetical protein